MASRESRTTLVLAGLVAALGLGVGAGATAYALLADDGQTVVRQVTVTSSEPAAVADGLTIAENYDRASKAVVEISATSTGPSFGEPATRAQGSGFVYDAKGHIVTNQHVVDGASSISVSFWDGSALKAKLVGSDPSTDLAVIKVDAPASLLDTIPLGDSSDVVVGDAVLAFGSPFGLEGTVTSGIVSALHRQMTAPNNFTITDTIQTDAPINHGNSGGPLLNTRGQVIGVNTQIETGGMSTGNVGIGFSVPSNTVKDVVAQILSTGKVDHAYLGIRGQEITSDLAEAYKLHVETGVLIGSVEPGSGAAKARLQGGDRQVVVAGETYVLGGDIIVAFDGQRISSIEELRDAIAAHEPGEKIKLAIFRGAKKTSVTITLGRQPLSPQG